MLIYHIVLPTIWEKARIGSFYEAESLASEGFIHCSYADQLDAVIERYYSNAGDITVVTIESERLTAPFVREPSTNNELYPHIYGPINIDAVLKAETRPVGSVPLEI